MAGRCRKHEPVSAVTVPSGATDTAKLCFAMSYASMLVRCSHCDMFGTLTNGRQRSGRPRRIIWFRYPHGEKAAAEQVEKWDKWFADQPAGAQTDE